MSSDIYRRGRSVVFALHVHLVFVSKFRRDVFTARALEVVRESMTDVCREFDVTLREFNGEDDHVHLLVDYKPTVQLSKLVNSLKGVSSRRLRARKWPEIEEKLWGGHLWSPSYFAASCGGVTLEILKNYIDGQRSPEDPMESLAPLSHP
jgi:putative transposase